jgi:uncharacterized membrane protein
MTAPATRSGADRLLYIDWLRGWAVLFMFEAHLYPAWMRIELLGGREYGWTKIFAGYAAPLFLFLAGVGMAMGMVSAQARGKSRADTRRNALKRGFQIFLGALAFRLQEHLLGGGASVDMLRVDILNCIGVSMVLAATFFWPAERGLFAWRALLAAAVVMVATPFLYSHPLPPGHHWPISSYFVDPRDYIFPLIPWAGFIFAGLAAGTLWARGLAPASEGKRRWLVPAMFIAGAIAVLGCWIYNQRFELQPLLLGGKDRTRFSYLCGHVGWILVGASVGWVLQRFANPRRFGPVRQLGRTSLLMYWVHVELVYGHLSGGYVLGVKSKLSFLGATVGLAGLTLSMLVLSVFRTRYLGAFRAATIFEKLWADFVAYVRESWRKSGEGRRGAPKARAARTPPPGQ